MKQEGVAVALCGRHTTKVQEHPNPRLKRHHDFKGFLASSLISVEPGNTLEIEVEFEEDFDFDVAGGVAVILVSSSDKARDDNTTKQCYWFARSRLPFTERLIRFRSYKDDFGLPLSERQQRASGRRFRVPSSWGLNDVKNAGRDWQIDMSTNAGCIAVFILRGNLHNRPVRATQGTVTDPPCTKRFSSNDMSPRVIRQEWFDALPGERGHPIAFQFGNIKGEELHAVLGVHTPMSSVQDRSSFTGNAFNDDNDDDADEIPVLPAARRKRREAQTGTVGAETTTRAKRRLIRHQSAHTDDSGISHDPDAAIKQEPQVKAEPQEVVVLSDDEIEPAQPQADQPQPVSAQQRTSHDVDDDEDALLELKLQENQLRQQQMERRIERRKRASGIRAE